MVCEPWDSVEVVKVAVPDPERLTVATLVPSIVNVAEPAGVAVDGEFAVTVAVKVTGCAKPLGFCELVTAAEVDAALTV